MPKKGTQIRLSGKEPQEPFDIAELVEILAVSALTQGKKLAYLYSIAAGLFSLSHFDGILDDMDQEGKQLAKQKKRQEDKISKLKDKEEKLQVELANLRIGAAVEQEQNLDKVVAEAARESEKKHEVGTHEAIKTIKTKLHKKKKS